MVCSRHRRCRFPRFKACATKNWGSESTASQFAQEDFRPSEVRISKRTNPGHRGAQRHAIRGDQLDNVNTPCGAAGTGEDARCVQAANRPLKTVIHRSLRNNEGGCKISAGEVPPDGSNALGVRSQTIAFAHRQLSCRTQIDTKLKLVVIEGLSRSRPPRSNHLSEEQFSRSFDVNLRSLRIARAGMRNQDLRKDVQSSPGFHNERLCDVRLSDGISCTENAGGAWARQNGTRTLTNPDIHLDMIPGKETRRRINHVDDQMISIPMWFAEMHWRTKRLSCEKRSSRGVSMALNAQMPPDSEVWTSHRARFPRVTHS
jgi:hypothetical protein